MLLQLVVLEALFVTRLVITAVHVAAKKVDGKSFDSLRVRVSETEVVGELAWECFLAAQGTVLDSFWEWTVFSEFFSF